MGIKPRQQSNSNRMPYCGIKRTLPVSRPDHAADLLQRANNLVTAILSFKRLGWLKSDREDYRQDVLLALLSKLKRLNDLGVEPIKDYDAHVVQPSLNLFRRRQRARIEDPVTESTDTDELNGAMVDARETPEQPDI